MVLQQLLLKDFELRTKGNKGLITFQIRKLVKHLSPILRGVFKRIWTMVKTILTLKTMRTKTYALLEQVKASEKEL